MALITIIKNNIKKTCVVTEGTTVLNMLIENGEKIYSPCGGNGTCGKCYVGVEGNVSEPCDVEIANCPNGVRLACKTIILGDATVFLENSKMEVCTSVEDSQIEIDPIVKNENDNYGIAIDIGTTTVAMYLCDCNTGSIVGVKGFSNPQSSFGADVISRMDKIIKDNSSLYLQKNAVLTEINSAILELSNTNNIDISSIHSAVICGNTVMQHIFAGIDPSTIAVAPFEAKTLFENGHYKASDLGLNIDLNGTCLLAPCVASYVGGDITCGVIATNLDEYDSQAVFLDIGTNGEIGLCGKNGMYFCSAAAGPAFEGANIKCGMPGVPGAISSISNDGAIKTIGDVEPTGICGSGLIDAVAYMLNNGILDEDGAIDDEADNVVDIDGITAYQLTDKVFITQKDIRELQLAKAAICAGILTLIHKSNLKLNNISKVVLAGGFGSRINPDNAKTIGLIPKDLDCEIEFYGNTAGQGAIELLLSKQKRDRINSLVNISKYTELSNDAYFSNCYIEQMEF